MTGESDKFVEFLKKWVAERIGSLGDKTDPSDWDYMVKTRSKELSDLAREKGMLADLLRTVQPYSNTCGYVRAMYAKASQLGDATQWQEARSR